MSCSVVVQHLELFIDVAVRPVSLQAVCLSRPYFSREYDPCRLGDPSGQMNICNHVYQPDITALLCWPIWRDT